MVTKGCCKSVWLLLALLCSLVWPALAQETSGPEFTPEEKAWLEEHPVIRISGDPDWLPIEAFDSEGQYVGIVPEYIKLLESRAGIEFKIVPSERWDQTMEMAKNGELDIVSAIESEDRREFLNFTQSYYDIPVVIVTRKTQSPISDPHWWWN